MNVGARLDRLPVSGFHYRILLLVAAGMFLDAFEVYLGGGVISGLVKSNWSTLQQSAMFMSATFAGMVLGAATAGSLGDRFGRRFSYQANLLIFGLASLAGAAAPSMSWLIAARFFMGIGLGAEIVVGYATVSEFMPPASRGKWLAGLAALANSALLISAMLGYLIIPTIGWRWMFVLVGVFALIVWFARKSMPESPRWLEAAGQTKEANRIVLAIEAEVARTHVLPPILAVLAGGPAEQRPFRALFSPQLWRRTLTASVILVVMNTVNYGFVAWIPTFMAKSGMSVVSSLGYTTLMSIGGPVGALLGMVLSERLGRKSGIISFSVFAVCLGCAYPMVREPLLAAMVGFGLVTAIYTLIAFAFALYIPELFPTDIRMRGSGFAHSAGRLMTILTPYIVIALFTRYGVKGVVVLMVILLIIQIVVVAMFGIETKGQSLEALAQLDPVRDK